MSSYQRIRGSGVGGAADAPMTNQSYTVSPNTGFIRFANSTQLKAPSDGFLQVLNSAGTAATNTNGIIFGPADTTGFSIIYNGATGNFGFLNGDRTALKGLSATMVVTNSAGSAILPSIGYSGATQAGLYYPGTIGTQLAFTAGGVQQLLLDGSVATFAVPIATAAAGSNSSVSIGARGATQAGLYFPSTLGTAMTLAVNNIDYLNMTGAIATFNANVQFAGRVRYSTSGTATFNANLSMSLITNLGQGAGVVYTLPLSNTSGIVYNFAVMAGQTVTIQSNAADTIRVGSAVTSTGGTVLMGSTLGNALTIISLGSNQWVATSIVGTLTTT